MKTASPKPRITTGQSVSLAAKEKAPPKRGLMTGYKDNTEGDSEGTLRFRSMPILILQGYHYV